MFKYKLLVPETYQIQGDHFPDHMKFPDFSSRGKQRLPGIECLPIGSTVVVSY